MFEVKENSAATQIKYEIFGALFFSFSFLFSARTSAYLFHFLEARFRDSTQRIKKAETTIFRTLEAESLHWNNFK